MKQLVVQYDGKFAVFGVLLDEKVKEYFVSCLLLGMSAGCESLQILLDEDSVSFWLDGDLPSKVQRRGGTPEQQKQKAMEAFKKLKPKKVQEVFKKLELQEAQQVFKELKL